MNIDNLKIFRRGFNNLIRAGVVTQETFDMLTYRREPYKKTRELLRPSFIPGSSRYFLNLSFDCGSVDCGSVGCFLGWAPFVKELEKHKEPIVTWQQIDEEMDWGHYSSKIFEMNEGSEGWDFLFSSNWVDCDNTPEGALARLDILIKGDFKLKRKKKVKK